MVSPLVAGELTTRLSALRWTVAGVLEEEDKKRKARTSGTFFKQSGADWSEIPAAHSTLNDISENGASSVVTLRLVVPA
jgi:hypothetical protein